MVLNFLKNSALDLLVSEIPTNIEKYDSKAKWIDEYFEEKGMGNYYFNSMISVPDVELQPGDSKTDFANAVRMYEALKEVLNPVQASDLRLWGYLAHNTCWDYMRERWAIDVPSEDDDDGSEANKLAARIGARYFFKASKGKAFVRQGIARLYWSAYLTYDETNENPYEYTEYFLSKQDIFAVSTERSLARNKTLLLSALKVLKDHEDLKRKDIRQYFLKINQAGGLLVLDSLSKDSALELAKRTLDEVLATPSEDEPVDIINSETATEVAATTVIVANKKSIVKAENVRTKVVMPIAVSKNKIQTKPSLIGLKVGDTFKIRKNTWRIIEIR